MTKQTPSLCPFERISLKWNMIEAQGQTIDETFAMLAELGYDGVEVDGPTSLSVQELLAASRTHGVAMPGVINASHWSHPLSSSDSEIRARGIEGAIAALQLANELGAGTVLLVPGVVDARVSYATAWQRAIDALEKLLPKAKHYGVQIALENVWNNFLLSPLEAAALVDRFDDPMLGWYLDVGNLLRNGFPTDWIAVLAHRILRVDLKDYSLDKMNTQGLWKGFDVELGDGSCDWAAVNAALRAIGYSGWASVEVPGGGPTRLAEIRTRVERIRQL